MRLTQVMLAKGFGGGERWFVDLSLALAEAGHSVQAICHKRFTAAAMLSRHEAIEVVQVDVRGWWDLIARWRIEKAIAGFRPGRAPSTTCSCGSGRTCCTPILPVVPTSSAVSASDCASPSS